jgi:cyanophycinase
MPSTSPRTATATRGWLIPIGGKLADPEIIDRFIQLCGGPGSRIVIIPTASQDPEMGEWYEQQFAEHGVKKAQSVNFQRRNDCDDADWVLRVQDADGVFITGGDQLRLTTIIGGTPAFDTMFERFQQGMPIAGTSAGAAVMSAHMIARGDEGATPRAGMVTLAPGFGLTTQLIVDQHFRQRDRLGRLLTALSFNPALVGLGVDEDTAAFIAPDDSLDVLGSGAVTVVDTSSVDYSSMHAAEPGEPVTLVGVRLHVLAAGAGYDLRSRTAFGTPVETVLP